LFCQRSWWYQRQGTPSQNKAEMAGGSAYHYRHGRMVIIASLFQAAGWFLLILALILFVVGLTIRFLG